MQDITVAITAASYHGNKGAAAMLQSSIKQLYHMYGAGLSINLMSTYPKSDQTLAPFDFINVVSSTPKQVLFFAFPMAVLYWLFRWLPPVRKLLLRNKILRAYAGTDIVLDEAGISFVDSRGFIMNTYAAVTMAIPLLLGVPVVKYSQALGSFSSWYNRMLAKIILPKLKLICVRGSVTEKHLSGIGVIQNVKLCADGAFSMPDDKIVSQKVDNLCASDVFYKTPYIALSLSSVVDERCSKRKINYRLLMSDFIAYLNKEGFGVLLIANAIRLQSEKPRNNDVPLCDAIHNGLANKDKVRWYREDMGPEKVRELIGRSEMLVGSRFHAMIAALEQEIPTLLVGWSHKYKEVLDMFHLGEWAVDYANLSLPLLTEKFQDALLHKDKIKRSIVANLPTVRESSQNNIRFFTEVADSLPKRAKGKLFDFKDLDRYTGFGLSCRIGYAADSEMRRNGASGGMVTALLCGLLREKEIDGAWVTRSLVKNGELTFETMIATTEEEIRRCSSSIYMNMPLQQHVGMLASFPGRIAVVMLPCQIRGLNAYLDNNPELREKVALRISLYCSGSHEKQCTLLALKKKGISLSDVKRLIFRRGHFRGKTVIQKNDGSEQEISYTKTICAYKNAFYFAKPSCMLCQDQFGKEADLSFGDIWLKAMKKNPIKHTSCLIHSEAGLHYYQSVVARGDIVDFHFDRKRLLLSQKRALVFKYNCAKAKVRHYQKQGKGLCLDSASPCRWNHRLAYRIARRNQETSKNHPERVTRLPLWYIYYKMCFIRFLLSF